MKLDKDEHIVSMIEWKEGVIMLATNKNVYSIKEDVIEECKFQYDDEE